MKTPSFWNNKNLVANILLPFGLLYSVATSLRLKISSPKHSSCPVICIGNLTAGGAGKTPVALSISSILKKEGYNPVFVSRGYGGQLNDIMVDYYHHTAQEVGDEPLLLARRAPVSINSNRYKAAERAVRNGADIIVMDDGFQNPTLYKDISFLVFDGGFGIGNGYPLPAGPLRESFAKGCRRANAAIIIGEDKFNLSEKLKNLPIFRGKIVSYLPELTSRKAIAFAGIGRPQKFYNSLIEHGIELVDTFDFPDHHFYTDEELRNMLEQAETLGVELITTAKDYVKIPAELQSRFKVLEIDIEWENFDDLQKFISDRL